jgi:hypothetical protein
MIPLQRKYCLTTLLLPNIYANTTISLTFHGKEGMYDEPSILKYVLDNP